MEKREIKIFEELISTIERNSVDNKADITNVELWAKSWRSEMYQSHQQPQQDKTNTQIDKRLDYDVHF